MEGEGHKDVETPSPKMSTCQEPSMVVQTLPLKGIRQLGPKCFTNILV